MDINLRETFLTKISLFQNLSKEDLQYITENSRERLFKENDIIFSEGDPAGAMYVIGYGEISISKGKREIARFLAGSLIGEMAVLDKGNRSATGIALTESLLLELPESFLSRIGSKSKSLLSILETMSGRVRESNNELEENYLNISTVVHDLRNAITSLSYASFIKNTPADNSMIVEWADRILDAKEFMTSIVDDALRLKNRNLSKIDFDNTDIMSVITSTVEIYTALHPDVKDKTVTIDAPENLLDCPYNRRNIVRVLSNLIINACQASDDNAEVTIAVSSDKNSLYIEIIDSGSGIDPRVISQIFDPMFTTKIEGNGLGLHACKSIVEELHKGKLTVESEENKGAIFKISLPLVQSS